MKRIDLVKVGGFQAGEHLQTSDVEVPTPSKNQVLLKVQASAINPVDWKMAEYNFLLPENTFPVALGCDIAGTILQSPSDPSWVGKRVLTYLGASKVNHAVDKGGFVEQVVVDVDLIAEIPDSMTFAQAASLTCGALTAQLLLEELQAKKKDWILIWGASSSVGYNTIQLAKKQGYKVIAVASSAHEASLKALGCVDGFVDYRTDDVTAKVTKIVGDDNGQLNGAVDCIGSATTFQTCAELLKKLGSKEENLAVSSTLAFGLPTVEGVIGRPVDLGSANDKPESRAKVSQWLRDDVTNLTPMTIHSVQGPYTAETVEQAFQINKNGVSGKKVVIEWN